MAQDGDDRGFLAAIRAGDLRKQLTALRDFLAEQLPLAPHREQAPIAAQLRQVLIDLDALPLTGEVSPVDEIKQRRAARRSGAAAS